MAQRGSDNRFVVTSETLRRIRFAAARNGYERTQVDQAIGEAASALDALERVNAGLEASLAEALGRIEVDAANAQVDDRSQGEDAARVADAVERWLEGLGTAGLEETYRSVGKALVDAEVAGLRVLDEALRRVRRARDALLGLADELDALCVEAQERVGGVASAYEKLPVLRARIDRLAGAVAHDLSAGADGPAAGLARLAVRQGALRRSS